MTRNRLILTSLLYLPIICGLGFVLTVDFGVRSSPHITMTYWFLAWVLLWLIGVAWAYAQYDPASNTDSTDAI